MASYITLSALFTDIADSIRAKTGSAGEIVATDFPSEIDSLPSVSIDGVKQSGSFNLKSRIMNFKLSNVPFSCVQTRAVVLNNEVHLLGSNQSSSYKEHYKWYGSS